MVLTTGGTGVAPRDVTPEATAPFSTAGPSALRRQSGRMPIAKTPHGMLSRGVAGIRGQTLVVNLPGSPGGCRDGFAVLRPALGHAVKLIAGEETSHRQT